MNETLVTVCGNVVAEPVRRVSKSGTPFVTFRMASTSRRYDAASGEYVDAGTNFVNVTAFRSLGANLVASLRKGSPVIVYGRMRVTQWSNGDKQGTSVDIDAYSAGFDMTRGRATFERVAAGESHAWGDAQDVRTGAGVEVSSGQEGTPSAAQPDGAVVYALPGRVG